MKMCEILEDNNYSRPIFVVPLDNEAVMDASTISARAISSTQAIRKFLLELTGKRFMYYIWARDFRLHQQRRAGKLKRALAQ